MSRQYILGPDHVAMPEPDLSAWVRWMGTANRVVGRTELESVDGEVGIVTVFLGLDHNDDGDGARQLFETTAILSNPGAASLTPIGIMDRYPTWATAEAGHAQAVEKVRERIAKAKARRRG